MSEVQSIIFDKSIWGEKTARYWLKSHNYKHKNKMHETGNYLRFRQKPPSMFNDYRTMDIGNGIAFIVGIP